MGSEIKIPTLLGLGVLLVGIVIGVLLVIQNQSLSTKASSSGFAENITVSNITDHSVSISWQTENPVSGFVQAGPQDALGLTFKDDRDTDQPQNHRLHFVTVNNLPASSTFYYQVTSGSQSFPETAQTFTTAGENINQNYAPLIGTVLDVNSQPVQEALVILSIEGAQLLSAITKTSGNFILPLASLRTTDLSKSYLLDGAPAKLTVVSGDKVSNGTISLPFSGLAIPPITLGQDFQITPPVAPIQVNKFDLNGDKLVNAADLSLVVSQKGANPKDKRFDLNGDDIIDQKDLDLISDEIERVNERSSEASPPKL